MERNEKRQTDRDARIAKNDLFIKETEEKKLSVANAMVEVLSGLLKKKSKKSKKKKRKQMSSSSSSSSGSNE